MRNVAVVGLVLALCTAPQAQDRKNDGKVAPDGVIWSVSWEEAVKEATARNVPIHFTLHKDG
jgi:hypothetical protein